MNFLAHCYLSGSSENILIGNFIADSVRGNKWEDYSTDVCRGIKLHRLIDQYTDTHATVRVSKARLYNDFGKYASVIVDVFYDHLLAVEWNKYSPLELKSFTINIYRIMRSHAGILPAEVLAYLPYMESQNWLYNYRTKQGIAKALKGLSQRTSFPVQMQNSIALLENNYQEFLAEFNLFFPEIIRFVDDTLQQDDFLQQC